MEVEVHNDGRIFKKYVSVLVSENLPSNETEYKQKDVTLKEIAFIIKNLSSFVCTFSNDFSQGQVVVKLTELIVGLGLVYKVDTDDRDFGPEDFPDIAENAVSGFECLKSLLQEVNDLEHGQKRNFLIDAILLCATHFAHNHWTSDASILKSEEFMTDLLLCTQHQSVSSLLTVDSFHPTIFKGALKKIRPSLLKDTWVLHPSACHVFSYLLHHIKHPYLVDYLSDVFPPAFMFVSYHNLSQQVMGIRCFNHILDNVPQSLIKLDGKEDAIYHSLFSFTFSKAPNIATELYPCLLKLPMMKEQKTKLVLWDVFDKVFNNLLSTMARENNLTLKNIFLAQILAFSEHTPPFKHLKRLMTVVKETISDNIYPNSDCQITALKILKCVIQCCWPRMPYYCFEVLVSILELQENKANLSNLPSAIEELDKLCEECILLLKYACGETFETMTAKYIKDCPDLDEAKFLKNVLVENSS